MPLKADREYRSAVAFDAVEDQDGKMIVEGYATTFDEPYDMGPFGFKEMIRSDALDGADMSDVIFQLNHEGIPLARQKNGTLGITVDSHGLHVRAEISGCATGREVYEAIKNRLIDKMSWGFVVDTDGWEYDRENRTSIITKIKKVYDVSAVSIPANNDTEIAVRSGGNPVKTALDEDMRKRSAIAASLALMTV